MGDDIPDWLMAGAWLTAGVAATILSERSKRVVRPDYLRTLARAGKIRTAKMGERMTLYFREDVENYTVEGRGKKAAQAARARAGKERK
jgi:hypothetical protein